MAAIGKTNVNNNTQAVNTEDSHEILEKNKFASTDHNAVNRFAATEPSSKHKRKGVFVVGTLLIIVAVLGLVAMILTRSSETSTRRQELTKEAALGPHVKIVTVQASPGNKEIVLTAEARPFAAVTLYAKVSGYLKSIKVDKGDHVTEGQILATIESPETDRAYQAAAADAKNKASKAVRLEGLLAKNLVSQQDVDQAKADAEIVEAQVSSLASQKEYELIRAPFSGTVTARYADAGALVQSAANSQTSALPIVTISQSNKLRIIVYLDQRDASVVRTGNVVEIRDPNLSGVVLHATVTRYTGELDPKTRMLLAEVDLDNQGHLLVPGSYVQVTLHLHGDAALEVPSQALIVRNNKSYIPVVLSGNTIHFQEVIPGDNDGTNIRILSGLRGDEHVAVNLGNSVEEGHHVQPIRDTINALH